MISDIQPIYCKGELLISFGLSVPQSAHHFLFISAYGTFDNIAKHEAIILHRKYLEDSGIVPKGYRNRAVGTKVVAMRAVSHNALENIAFLVLNAKTCIHLCPTALMLHCSTSFDCDHFPSRPSKLMFALTEMRFSI